ncbi:uracil-DNA glycosylase [Mycolicibacterium sp. Y3]
MSRELPHPRTGRLFASPVPPGTGWPGDRAKSTTPVAHDPEAVATLAARAGTVAELDAACTVCAACPRLVSWREEIAVTKRRAYADEPYWGRPVAGWGAARPRVLVVGLAPAAHGANRTGRVFTGDRSGDQLFAAMHRAGLVSSGLSVDAADGMRANGVRIVAPVRCAPPANKPTPAERLTCAPWLLAEWRLVAPYVRVVVALGGFAWQIAQGLLAEELAGQRKPVFGHGAVATLSTGRTLLGCYHPSQQNMFTGRLTPAMLDDVFVQARERSGITRR